MHSGEPRLNALFLHSLLVRVHSSVVKTEWQVPLLTIVQTLPTPGFLPIRAYELASPLTWNLPQLIACCLSLILLASTKIHLSRDAYADLCLEQAMVTSFFFLQRPCHSYNCIAFLNSVFVYRQSHSLEWLYLASSVSHGSKLNQQ